MLQLGLDALEVKLARSAPAGRLNQLEVARSAAEGHSAAMHCHHSAGSRNDSTHDSSTP